jgi:hypothetical protein
LRRPGLSQARAPKVPAAASNPGPAALTGSNVTPWVFFAVKAVSGVSQPRMPILKGPACLTIQRLKIPSSCGCFSVRTLLSLGARERGRQEVVRGRQRCFLGGQAVLGCDGWADAGDGMALRVIRG